jgi:predicted transposase YdaD
MGMHDNAFRKLMKERGVAEALLRERLPEGVVRRFAGPPQLLSESFVGEALDGSFADVVLRVPLLGGEDAFVYCLIEHKRSEHHFVLVQVLRYLAALYAQLARDRAGGLLPAVVPLIIYNGDARWSGPRRFSELLDADLATQALSIAFEVLLLDLGAESIATLSQHATLRGGLLGLKAAATPFSQFEEVLSSMFDTLGDDPSTLAFLIKYLLRVSEPEVLPVIDRLLRGKEKAMQTAEEYLLAKAYRRAKRELTKKMEKELTEKMEKELEKGREEGREEGREDALRTSLRFTLTRRFKRIPASVEEKLAAADGATLQRWFEAALDAKSLKAVFATN